MWANHAKNPIVFEGNRVYDVLGPYPRGQAVQFDNGSGGDGQSRIEGNVSDWMERTGKTAYEDHINVYMSSGEAGKPILIKRGLANTLQELLMSAEYVMAGGNEKVILCERGIRTFETATRNTLDLSAVPML